MLHGFPFSLARSIKVERPGNGWALSWKRAQIPSSSSRSPPFQFFPLSLSLSLAFSRGSREKRISFRLHSTSAVNERGQDIGLPRTTSTFPPLRNTFHHPCKMARDSRQRVTLVHANRPLPRTPTHFLEPSRASRMREECVRNVREVKGAPYIFCSFNKSWKVWSNRLLSRPSDYSFLKERLATLGIVFYSWNRYIFPM